jgi:uncharacterized protein
MKIEGSYKVSAPRARVWQALLDPEVLGRAMPGCEKLKPNADGCFNAEISIGVAAVKGKYHGQVRILDPVVPERYRLSVEGQGKSGFMKGEGMLTLIEQGPETIINYSGDVQVGGVVASVGQRLILSAAKQIVNHFFSTFAKQVQQPSSQPASAANAQS